MGETLLEINASEEQRGLAHYIQEFDHAFAPVQAALEDPILDAAYLAAAYTQYVVAQVNTAAYGQALDHQLPDLTFPAQDFNSFVNTRLSSRIPALPMVSVQSLNEKARQDFAAHSLPDLISPITQVLGSWLTGLDESIRTAVVNRQLSK